jgi:hypothetical protein
MRADEVLRAFTDAVRDRRDAVRGRTQELVDAALDRVFAEPLPVPDAATARALLADDRLVSDSAEVGQRLTRFAVVGAPVVLSVWRRLGPTARLAGRVTPGGHGVRFALTLVPATAALIGSARHGVHELQVLASLLVARFRAAGITPDRGLVRAVTLSVYLDPGRPPDLDTRVTNSSTTLARRWIVRTIPWWFHGDPAKKTNRRIRAIEGLDLGALHATWRASTVIDI